MTREEGFMTRELKIEGGLPEKLSDLIDVAVEDALAFEAEEQEQSHRGRYFGWDMGVWCDVTSTRCEVCMAGAVMFQRTPGLRDMASASPLREEQDKLRTEQEREGVKAVPAKWVALYPSAYELRLELKFRAIDHVRSGDLYTALCKLGIWTPWGRVTAIAEEIQALYSLELRRAPWVTYLEAADALRELGL